MTSVNKTGKKTTAKKQVGQHPGTIESKQFEKSERGWVNITGMVGQHETERWVSMLRNLQEYRIKTGLTQKQVARKLGFTNEVSICHWERPHNTIFEPFHRRFEAIVETYSLIGNACSFYYRLPHKSYLTFSSR